MIQRLVALSERHATTWTKCAQIPSWGSSPNDKIPFWKPYYTGTQPVKGSLSTTQKFVCYIIQAVVLCSVKIENDWTPQEVAMSKRKFTWYQFTEDFSRAYECFRSCEMWSTIWDNCILNHQEKWILILKWDFVWFDVIGPSFLFVCKRKVSAYDIGEK